MMSKSRSESFNEIQFKVIVIGESATGKSCLMLRYIRESFIQDYTVTVGVEFGSINVKIDDSYSAKLQIWDTAGQESFRSIVKNFYRNTSAVFLVYNITKRSTFNRLHSWLKEAKENSPKNAMLVLIGTHQDQVAEDPSKREVTRQQAEQWMRAENISLFFQTSAKTNKNVRQAFDQTANQLFLNYIKLRTASSDTKCLSNKPYTQLSNTTSNNKNKCC